MNGKCSTKFTCRLVVRRKNSAAYENRELIDHNYYDVIGNYDTIPKAKMDRI